MKIDMDALRNLVLFLGGGFLAVMAGYSLYRQSYRKYIRNYLDRYKGRGDTAQYLAGLKKIRNFALSREERWKLTMHLVWGYTLAGEFTEALREVEFWEHVNLDAVQLDRLEFFQLDGSRHVITGTPMTIMQELEDAICMEREQRNRA